MAGSTNQYSLSLSYMGSRLYSGSGVGVVWTLEYNSSPRVVLYLHYIIIYDYYIYT